MQFRPDLRWDTPAGTSVQSLLALGTKNAMNPMVIVD